MSPSNFPIRSKSFIDFFNPKLNAFIILDPGLAKDSESSLETKLIESYFFEKDFTILGVLSVDPSLMTVICVI